MQKLKWLTIILPLAFLGLTDYARHQLWPGTLHTVWGFLFTHVALTLAIAVFSGVVFRRIDAMHAQLTFKNRSLTGLHDVGQALGQSLDLDQVLDQALQRILDLTGGDRAEVLTAPDDTGVLTLRARVGQPIVDGKVGSRFGDQGGIPAWPSATGAPLVVPATIADARPDLPQISGLAAFASVPLKVKDQVVGVMHIGATRAFAGELTEVLAALGAQIGMVIENARLHNRVRETRDFLDSLIANSADGIIITDVRGRILSWNRGAETIYGFTREEAVGSVMPMIPPHLVAETGGLISRLLAGETLLNLETRRLHRDGHLIDVVVTACPVLDVTGQVTALVGFSKDITELKRLQAQLEELALLQERERIGMDLHDGVIQSLYAAALQLEDCALHVAEAPQAVQARLDRLGDDLNAVIQDIRTYIFRLRPDAAGDADFERGLEQLVQAFQVNSLVATQYDIEPGLGPRLSPNQVTHLLQIGREALANILRHARSSQVQVTAAVIGNCLELIIADNGVGLNNRERGPHQLGLRNMAARAQAAGGEFTVDGTPGCGTRVAVRVPLAGGQEAAQ